jgi:hypothetical protein
MEYNLVFLNPICVQLAGRTFAAYGSTYVTEFARNTFAANGIHSCRFPLEKPVECKTVAGVIREIYIRLLECLEHDRLNIVGVTHWTTHSWLPKALLNTLRFQCRELKIPLMIVGGGPFFIREHLSRNGSPFPDSIEAALSLTTADQSSATYDAVVYGGLQAFLDLLRAIEADDLKFEEGRVIPNTLPPGYYHRQDSRIEGSGRSRNGSILKPPTYVIPYKESYVGMIMFSNNCPNGCDYCFVGQSHKFTRHQVRIAVRDFKGKLEREYSKESLKIFRNIRLLDPNPFATYSRQHTCECLEELSSELGFTPNICCFYDAYSFREPEIVLKDIQEQNVISIATGRESVCEPGLSFMGRKHLGKARTTEDIKEERTGLLEVIRKQKEARNEFILHLFYVFTPADTVETVQESFADMQYFQDQSDDKVHVSTVWEPLWPNSGSLVMKKYTHLLSDNPYFVSTNEKVWDMNAIKLHYPHSAFQELLSGAIKPFHGES